MKNQHGLKLSRGIACVLLLCAGCSSSPDDSDQAGLQKPDQTTEETDQQSMQQPVQDPAEDPVQVPVQDPAQDPVQVPVQDPVQVPVQDPVQDPAQEASAPPLDEAVNDLLTDLAAYRSETAELRVRQLVETVRAGALASRALPEGTLETDDISGTVTTPTHIIEYDCALGGRLAVEESRVRINGSGYSRAVDVDTFRFDDCRPGGDASVSANGKLLVSIGSRSGSGFSDVEHLRDWSDFVLVDPGQGGLEIDGNTVYTSLNTGDPTQSRTVAMNRFVETVDGNELVRIADAAMTLSTGKRRSGFYTDYSLTVSGTVTSNGTGQIPVMIETDEPMKRTTIAQAVDGFSEIPFSGRLSLRATDGRTIELVAPGTSVALLVDQKFMMSDGSSRNTEGVPFAQLTTRAPDDNATVEI